MNVNKETLAYIAGLIDSEGCVTLYGTGGQGTAHPMACFAPKLVIEMTSEDLVKWLHSTTGVGSVRRYVPKNLRARIRWRWAVKGREAVSLLRAVIPYLRLKREHAELLFQFAATRTVSCKRGLTEDTIVTRKVLVERIRHLNTRGRET